MRYLIALFTIGLTLSCAHKPDAEVPTQPEFATTIDKEAIRQSIMKRMPDVENCYKEALNEKPDLKGKLVLQWDLKKGQKPHNFQTIESLDPSVDQCIADVLKTTEFPDVEGDDTVKIRYPFVFAPNSGVSKGDKKKAE